GCETRHVRGYIVYLWRRRESEVALKAHSLNGNSLLKKTSNECVNGIRLPAESFRRIVVVQKLRGGIGFVRPAKRHIDVVRADHLEPDRVSEIAGVIDRLVDDVPVTDPALVTSDKG